LLTSPKRDFGDGGGSNGRGAPINKLIQCHMHCKEHGGERFDPITPPYSPIGGAHANVYRRHVCYRSYRSRRMISQMLLWTLIETAVALGQLLRRRRCVRLAEWVPPAVGGAFAEWVPQQEVPRAGAPAPAQAAGIYRQGQIAASSKLVGPRSEPVVPQSRCQASVKEVPGRCQADAEQPDEAMPSSRGDSRAAKRARTGGAKIAF
jgi:hypothetical protein